MVVGHLSSSVSIISEAVHTIVDLLASVMAYFSVKISGVIETLLIFVASGWIIRNAVNRLVYG